MNQRQIGKNIKQARENTDFTQADVAQKAEINVNYYARIERGEVIPSMEVLEAILKILKVKSSDVLPF
ncbi:MAG TPA: helix-turn-helix transcriptional regulator [Candidatus Saccharimonadales bacterium]|nr:helix-turn-helix transcriptional regulator [Candidatus Saccharimonadales bacterium]